MELSSTGFRRQMRMQGEVIHKWFENLLSENLTEIIPDIEAAKYTYVFSADMIKGFCKKGNLASPRVDAISKPVAELLAKMHGAGVENFVLVQEWHDPAAKEFEAFPEHGIAGTEEAQTIPELTELPFFDKFIIFPKNALTPAWSCRDKRYEPSPYTHPIYPGGMEPVFGESFDEYLAAQDMRIAVIAGNCTDLCVRELAMHLRMWANQHQKDMRVIIPENCVQTFDLPIDVAEEIGAMPHLGDVHHVWALYEMARNKIEVVKEIV